MTGGGGVGDLGVLLVHHSRECAPPYLSTRISNPLQLGQTEVVMGQSSMYLASWLLTLFQERVGEAYIRVAVGRVIVNT